MLYYLPDLYCTADQAVVGQFPTEKDGLHLRRSHIFWKTGGEVFFRAREFFL
jgi:hypothetical protein